MIQVIDAVKIYKSGTTTVEALRGVSLSIEKGDFMSIAGPSGSGKTTLLNAIGCIDTLTSGDVVIDGVEVSGSNHKKLTELRRQRIGFIFQTYNLIPVMSAYENVALTLALLKTDTREIGERTKQALREVGLEGMGRRRPAELSGGQQQRVAIARALVKKPSVVLADEPTANLDSKTGEKILQLMVDLNKQHGDYLCFFYPRCHGYGFCPQAG